MRFVRKLMIAKVLISQDFTLQRIWRVLMWRRSRRTRRQPCGTDRRHSQATGR